jgi:hypothetical protein
MKTEVNIDYDMRQFALDFYKGNYYLKKQQLEKLEQKYKALKSKIKLQEKREL